MSGTTDAYPAFHDLRSLDRVMPLANACPQAERRPRLRQSPTIRVFTGSPSCFRLGPGERSPNRWKLPAHPIDDKAVRVGSSGEIADGGLHVTVAVSGVAAVIRLHGELDVAAGPVLEEAVQDCLDRGVRVMKIDLGSLVFCDCAGLAVLDRSGRAARQAGAELAFMGPLHPIPAKLCAVLGIRLLDNTP